MRIAAELLMRIGQGELPCLFQMITGLYCPGCGGTRAALSLLHGQILRSLLYNPIPSYLLFGGAWCAGAVLLEQKRGGRKKGEGHGNEESGEAFLPRPIRQYLWILLAVTAVSFLLKNFLLIGFGIDLHAIAITIR